MKSQELKDWLGSKERDYKTGLTLFKELKVDTKSIKFFDIEEPQAIHLNMLTAKLANWDRVYNKEAEKAETKKETVPTPPVSKVVSFNKKALDKDAETIDQDNTKTRVLIDKSHYKYEDLPDDLKKAYDTLKPNHDNIRILHAEIKALPNESKHDEERKNKVNQMLDLQKATKAVYANLDEYFAPAADGESDNNGKKEITEASGKYTLEEIEEIADPVIQAQSKEKRIEANLQYIRRNANAEKEKTKAELDKRIAELVTWKVDYESRIGSDKTTDTGE